jgi:hypothetical protein
MPSPVRLWLEISHHGPFRVGGWAVLQADGAEAIGVAGGERSVDLERAALLGLLAALKRLPAGRGAILRTSSEVVASVPARLKATGEEAPAANLDLWAQAMTALAVAPLRLERVVGSAGNPSAFAAAWAELARERAKDRGGFSSPIPKSNLAKAGIPPA